MSEVLFLDFMQKFRFIDLKGSMSIVGVNYGLSNYRSDNKVKKKQNFPSRI